MKYGLNIRQDGALDLVSLGALVHRLDPGIIPFRKAAQCRSRDAAVNLMSPRTSQIVFRCAQESPPRWWITRSAI